MYICFVVTKCREHEEIAGSGILSNKWKIDPMHERIYNTLYSSVLAISLLAWWYLLYDLTLRLIDFF